MIELMKIETHESGQRRIIFPWMKLAIFITPRRSGTAPDKSGKTQEGKNLNSKKRKKK